MEAVKRYSADVVVIGGGLAGVCAAIGAARHGAEVLLLQDRPVLGGNSSSEIRVWACGANGCGNNRFAAETGIVGEIDLENLSKNPQGNPHLWDCLLLDFVTREKKIKLLLNTAVCGVETEAQRIGALRAVGLANGRELRIEGTVFIDCTGDGTVGYWAGAPFFMGREGRDVFGESMAPEQSDDCTLGTSLLYYSRDLHKPVRYVPPDFAYPLETMEQLLCGNQKPLTVQSSGCDLWWLEYGGLQNTIEDSEAIRWELQRLVYGVWNYIKNSGRYEADTLDLEWVGSVPGKRESRRLRGPYVLTQNDILSHQAFEDGVCCGGWPIDTHPAGGIYTAERACKQVPAGIYQIPLRCLYSSRVKNLMFAGRDMSASHVALATARVMKTCGVCGQAAGTAAALAVGAGKDVGGFSARDIQRLRRALRLDDVWLDEKPFFAEGDLVPHAAVTASSVRDFSALLPGGTIPVEEDFFFFLPALERLDTLSFLAEADEEQVLVAQFFTVDRFRDKMELSHCLCTLEQRVSSAGWVAFPCGLRLGPEQNIAVKLLKNEAISLALASEGCCGAVGSLGGLSSMKLADPCFAVSPMPRLYACEQVGDGVVRPAERPHLWISGSRREGNPFLVLDFGKEVSIGTLRMLFNPNFNRDFNSLRPDCYGNGWDGMPPELVKSFSIFGQRENGAYVRVLDVHNQLGRAFSAVLDVTLRRMKIEITETYGSDYGQIFEIFAFEKEAGTGLAFQTAGTILKTSEEQE